MKRVLTTRPPSSFFSSRMPLLSAVNTAYRTNQHQTELLNLVIGQVTLLLCILEISGLILGFEAGSTD
jgi:hypothetical protein